MGVVARGGLILLLLTSVASSSSEVVVPVTYVGPQNATEVISELELSGQAGRPLTVHVEGIVGTGKSTMLKAFDNHHGTAAAVDVLPEPVDQWTNLNGTDVLDLIFTDPQRWGATQEFLTFNSMMNEHLRKFGHVKAMERSIHSARLSFVETLHREGKMSDPEYAILDDWYRFLTNQELPRHPSGFDTDADLIVYLQISPEAAYERINGRGRPEEATVKMSYLRHLQQTHDDWLLHGKSGYPVPAKRVLAMSTEHSLEEMMKIYHLLTKKIVSSVPKSAEVACT